MPQGSQGPPGREPDSPERLWLRTIPLALAAAAVVLCVAAATFVQGVDEELYQYVGYAWLGKHERLYRDVFENKLPGVFFVWGLVWLVAGATPVLARLAGVASTCVGALLVARLGGRVWGRQAGTVAGALLLAAMCSGGLTFPFADTEAFAVPLALGGICLAWPRRGRAAPPGRALLSGALCGLAVLFKQVYVVELLVAVALTAQSVGAMRERMKRAATVLGGALLPILGCGVYLAWRGVLAEGVDATVLSLLQPGTCLPVGIGQRLLSAFLRGGTLLASPVPFVLCGLAVYTVVELSRGRNRLGVITCVLWLGAVMLAIGFQGCAWPHQFRQMVPALCLLAVGALQGGDPPDPGSSAGAQARRRLAGYFVAVAMAMSVLITADFVARSRQAARNVPGHGQVVAAIQAATGPNDRIWCYPRRDLYVPARRLSGTRYFTSLALARPGAQREVLGALASGAVRLVAIHRGDVASGRAVDEAFAGEVRAAFERKLWVVLGEHFDFRVRAGEWDLFQFRDGNPLGDSRDITPTSPGLGATGDDRAR